MPLAKKCNSDTLSFCRKALLNELTSIAAFEADLESASDLVDYGYDTHAEHDSLHTRLTDSLDLFWTMAEQKV